MITVALLSPESEGNVGAIARVMKNFSLSRLLLIDPGCDHLSADSMARSTHASSILKRAKVGKLSSLKKFDYVIATTAIVGTDYNIPRLPITPSCLSQILDRKADSCILFGPESSGLPNSVIRRCDIIVKIPSDQKYPTMNISHAAAIILYELFKARPACAAAPVKKKEKDILLDNINKLIDSLGFATEQKKDTQKLVWKRVINRSMLTRREAFALLGFFRKAQSRR